MRRNRSQIVKNKPGTILLFLILCISQEIFSQEQFVEPDATLITTVEFSLLSGGVILLKAQFGDFNDSLNFILDTGSGGISLDSTTTTRLGLEPTPSNMTILGIAGIRKVGFLYNRRLRFPGLNVDSLNFHINDYSILTSVYGEKIDGIIGYSLLSRYILSINYDSLKIAIYTNGRIKYPKGGWLYEPILRTLPVQTARIKDAMTANTRLLFDLGAGLCLMLSREFIEDSNFFRKKRVFYSKEAEGVGGKIDMELTVMKEIKIGPYKFRKVPVFVFDDDFNITSYPFLAGILGNDILRRFNVILNYAKKEFHLMPNRHYLEHFDYSYSGIELYLVDDRIILGDVAKGSPAEQAGLKEGDMVIGINNLIGQNIQKYKVILQSIGEKVKMFISREGEVMEFNFRVKSIL